MGTRRTHEQFLDELSKKGISVEPLEHYIDSQTAISCKCNVCGTIWNIRPNNLLNGYGCPTCGIKKRAKSQSKTNDAFLSELKAINHNIEITEEYKGARTPISCKCSTCGHNWKAAPTNLLRGRGCPKCAREIIADKNRRTHNEFLDTIKLHGHLIEPLEEFKGNSHPIKMRCNICEYEWTTSASSIVSGHGCPRCANNGIYSQEEFVHKLSTINPHIEILSGYERSNKPVKCMCTICGHIWDSSPNNLLRGTGCPACYHSTTSFIEQVVFEVFKLIVGKDAVLSRDRTAIGKELDVYVPSLNIAIEPGSWRWHKDKLENDQSKRSLCAEKGIRLITIYSDYDGDTPPFASDCICVKETLGFEGDHQSLKLLITDLLKLVNIELVISSYQWRSILSKAYVHSKRMTTLEFKNKVSKIHANIEVTGDYTGAWNRIECECKVCARKWSPAANSLLQGHGCPTCASKKRGLENRKSHDQFVAELKISNPKIEVISPYILSTEKITCLCSVCKNEWSALPGSLLEGKGCPKCAQEKRKKKG